jgi:hypothetical protein
MAPDQTSRVMGNKFDIRNGNGMEILNRFNIFLLDSLFQGWKFPTVWKSSNEIPLQRMGIFDCFEVFQFYSLFKDGSSRHFEIFQLYSCK